MHRAPLIVVACLSGCSTLPPSTCFTSVLPKADWKLYDGIPSDAEQMRKLAEPYIGSLREAGLEYWFFSKNRKMLMCRPVRADGCFSSLGIFIQESSGAWVVDPTSPPFAITCIA